MSRFIDSGVSYTKHSIRKYSQWCPKRNTCVTRGSTAELPILSNSISVPTHKKFLGKQCWHSMCKSHGTTLKPQVAVTVANGSRKPIQGGLFWVRGLRQWRWIHLQLARWMLTPINWSQGRGQNGTSTRYGHRCTKCSVSLRSRLRTIVIVFSICIGSKAAPCPRSPRF